ncbi:Lipocalin-like domain protein [Gemmatirosa kalamazoonensis]|uniref:Lipocalin-like domain protein n=1 Tax=Gemmatirosa kalamazoonensis TaxID=861299 RepID=W0RFI2_9BACT|nr:hypothetical protein [Gemmatirosa kalamazoonensis]AHG88148.1 Lipocalin-like domain protein [Gemmatirosa kalamazoonensis]
MRKLTTLMALTMLAACGSSYSSDITGTTLSNLAGTYDLMTVNGSGLPMMVQASNPKIELVSERIVVNANGTFTVTTNRRNTTTAGAVTTNTLTDAGTFGSSGSATTFHFNSGTTATATMSGNTLTLVAPTSTSVYTK